MSVPRLPAQVDLAAVYGAEEFVAHLRRNGWTPGDVPESVILTYGGFDQLCAAQPEAYTMNPMLGPGPGRFFSVNSTGGRVGVCCLGIGAPAAVAQFEVLAALGVQRFVSIGTAGGLQLGQAPGDVVLLTGAIRDEGSSYHYVAADVEVVPDAGLTDLLQRALVGAGLAVTSGLAWTTDVAFRETAEEIAGYRRQGVLAVEMEASALFAVAGVRQVPIASAVVVDCVFGDPIAAPTMDTATAFGKLRRLFLLCVEMLAT